MDRVGFDNEAYISKQSEHIMTRIAAFDRLYLEYGGKLFDDFHAARVLPGFQPDSKMKMLLTLADQVEVVVVINANDIERSKRRTDIGVTYDQEVMRMIDAFREHGLHCGSVCVCRYEGQARALSFMARMNALGVPVYLHYPIEGYPANLQHVLSDAGFGRNHYIETSRPLIVVTAPGPGSGKMATCLSQLYHEHKKGIHSGYAKFETFPIWNLPLKHHVNLAYEAATVDLMDVNMIDPFHWEAYGVIAVNYNRDVETFPILSAMFERLFGHSPYKSPTDMGVNMAGYCIVDDEVCRQASEQEVLRRYYRTQFDVMVGRTDAGAMNRMELLISQLGIRPELRAVVTPALAKQAMTGNPAAAIQLTDGRVVTGKTSDLLGASSAALLNSLKVLAGIDDAELLIPPSVIEPIQELKVGHLGNRNPRLHMDETLIALAISADKSQNAQLAVKQLHNLKGCEAHSTVVLSPVDSEVYRKLGIHLTVEPTYESNRLFRRE